MFCELQDCNKECCHHCFPVLNCSHKHEYCKKNGMFREMFDKTSILVTGCAGFVGSHLCEKLLNKGYDVYGIDNMNDYYDVSLKTNNVSILQKYSRFKFYNEDVYNTKQIENIKPFKIIHLASLAGVRNSLINPIDYVDNNVKAFVYLLEEARKNNVFHITYASSSSVYGLNEVPFHEDDTIDKCNSPYAASKKCMEIFAQTYSQLYNIPIVGLRFFTVYGPRGRPDMAPYKFMDAIHNNKPLTQFGDGTSSRDYTYVDDIVDGIINATEHKTTEVFNLGNSTPVALNTFINTLEEIIGKKAIINIIEEQKGDVPKTYAVIDSAKNKLDYNPNTSLYDGLKKMYDYYLKYN